MIECATLGTAALGRALDADANPLDGLPCVGGIRVRLGASAIPPAQRCAIDQPLWTGVRCIDALLTIGRGARIGLFGAPGAGKSTLLEAIVRGTRADAVVIGLIGERGREAQRWIAARDERATVICATGDRPAAERIRAAGVFIAQAQALASRGLHVLAVLDSFARYANALREVHVARGANVGRGGYPPSIFTATAQLVESAGAFACGSITMIATVLNDGDDHDPVSENARSLLDGHVQLSPRLAHAGRFPAIDVLASASRTMESVASPEHRRCAAKVRAALGRLASCEDARALGLEPADPATVAAVHAEPALEALLRQGYERSAPSRTLEALCQTADMLEEAHGHQL